MRAEIIITELLVDTFGTLFGILCKSGLIGIEGSILSNQSFKFCLFCAHRQRDLIADIIFQRVDCQILDLISHLNHTSILSIELVLIAVIDFHDFIFSFYQRLGLGVVDVDFATQFEAIGVDS